MVIEIANDLGIDELHLNEAYIKFEEVDSDHSKTISLEELKVLLHLTVAKKLHEDVLDRYAHVEFSSVDSDHNGQINFHEFLQVLLRHPLLSSFLTHYSFMHLLWLGVR